jgi:hypothetical protein
MAHLCGKYTVKYRAEHLGADFWVAPVGRRLRSWGRQRSHALVGPSCSQGLRRQAPSWPLCCPTHRIHCGDQPVQGRGRYYNKLHMPLVCRSFHVRCCEALRIVDEPAESTGVHHHSTHRGRRDCPSSLSGHWIAGRVIHRQRRAGKRAKGKGRNRSGRRMRRVEQHDTVRALSPKCSHPTFSRPAQLAHITPPHTTTAARICEYSNVAPTTPLMHAALRLRTSGRVLSYRWSRARRLANPFVPRTITPQTSRAAARAPIKLILTEYTKPQR